MHYAYTRYPRKLLSITLLMLAFIAHFNLAYAITNTPNKNTSALISHNTKNAYPSKNTITTDEIRQAQLSWANGLIEIGKVYKKHGDYRKTATNLIAKLYAYNYEKGNVLFKPTKASEHPFRKTSKSALSYFVGGNADYDEDKGFALTPWTHIVFHNDEIYVHGDLALAMGEYKFTNTKGETAKVEYTFGYVKNKDGVLKIVLHHSSLPYNSNQG